MIEPFTVTTIDQCMGRKITPEYRVENNLYRFVATSKADAKTLCAVLNKTIPEIWAEALGASETA